MRIVQTILALALLASLFGAGARIYHRLPAANGGANDNARSGAQQDLTIVFRTAISAAETKINLYPIDFSAAERDYVMSAHAGKTLEDLLGQRLKHVTPVSVSVDANGHAVARVTEGSWWMHAVSALANGESMEWRMPLTISQRPQTIELTSENAYERTRKF
jgi:hypothetical protein